MNPADADDRSAAQPARRAGTQPLHIAVERGVRTAQAPAVSVIVLVTLDVTSLERCLHSVHDASTTDGAHEIIVVANGTDPARLHTIREGEDVTLVRSPVNLGFAGGCNLASRFARGARLVFVNDDVVVAPGWLAGLTSAMDEDERTAVVGSKVLMRDGRLQEAGCVLWSDGSTSGVGRGDDPGKLDYQRRRPVDYVSFCSAMVRRTAWDAVGGFDERYFPAYYEDVDLCLRLQAHGWAVVYEPTSVVVHEEGGSASRDFRDFISRRNQGQFASRWNALLSQYPTPPTEADRAKAAEQALRRSARRQSMVAPPSANHRPPPTANTPVDDQEATKLIADKLYLGGVVKAEYIRLLEERAANRSVVDVVRSRLRRHLPSRRKR